ncbi:hypothetical protein CVT24_006497, partial [Panaeolus cyanescens]
VSTPANGGSKKKPSTQSAKVTKYTTQTTTLRRHMDNSHPGAYRAWAKAHNFTSMLPSDSKKRREELADATLKLQQTHVDAHFDVAPEKPEPPEAYSDELFNEVAIQWLVETNQPLQAFEHPTFKRMIALAARAIRSDVKLLSRKQTRAEILRMFKEQMKALGERLNSALVSGKVSLTCDAWQADNGDGYFAVTGHWIEEEQGSGPGAVSTWVEHEALLGFTQLNTSHNGSRLGQALYKICDRLRIVHKIGHITCDNASNNDTMLAEFARCYRLKTGKRYNVSERHIR